MELALALLLAVSLVALASTWSALRTERARALRAEDRLAAARPGMLASPSGPDADAGPFPSRPAEPAPRGPAPEPPSPPVPSRDPSASFGRIAAALVAPAERLAVNLAASEPALAAAAERLRTPLPPAAPALDVEEGSAPKLGTDDLDRAVATSERISDERGRLSDDVRSLRAALERVSTLDVRLGRGLTELSRSADALLPLASSVSGLADRANLLGLNVSLLAARAGEAGVPFEEAASELRALFEEARRLSREVSDAARRTDGGVRRISAFVEESTEAAAAGQERGAQASERLGALEGLSGHLERSLAEAVRSTRIAADEGIALARRLETARGLLESRAGEAARLRAEAEAARAALRQAAERLEALHLDGGALRAAVARVVSGA